MRTSFRPRLGNSTRKESLLASNLARTISISLTKPFSRARALKSSCSFVRTVRSSPQLPFDYLMPSWISCSMLVAQYSPAETPLVGGTG
jgi:hypothetical protein